MTALRKRSTNRQNAERSTGPRTREGQRRSSMNALGHGLLSRRPCLPDEDEQEFAIFSEDLRADLEPEGPIEDLLVDRIVFAGWRLRRVARVEVGLFSPPTNALSTLLASPEERTPSQNLALQFSRDGNGPDSFTRLARYETALERSLYRALHELERRQAVRRGEVVTPPVVADVEVSVSPEIADTPGDGFVS